MVSDDEKCSVRRCNPEEVFQVDLTIEHPQFGYIGNLLTLICILGIRNH